MLRNERLPLACSLLDWMSEFRFSLSGSWADVDATKVVAASTMISAAQPGVFFVVTNC
jgi:hypothetical protein